MDRPAGFWVRSGAMSIDLALLAFATLGIVVVLKLVGLGGFTGLGLVVLSGLALSAAYFILLTAVWDGQTMGKWAAGIEVRRLDGAPLGRGRAFVRWFGYLISMMSCGLGFVVGAFTSGKRGLQDYVAETRVVYAWAPERTRQAAVILCAVAFAGAVMAMGVLRVLALPHEAGLIPEDEAAIAGWSVFREGRKPAAHGRAMGFRGDARLCVTQAFNRLARCDETACRLACRVFLEQCLINTRLPEGFCGRVPPAGSTFRSLIWSLKTCGERKAPDVQACGRLNRTIQDFCHPPAQAAAPFGSQAPPAR